MVKDKFSQNIQLSSLSIAPTRARSFTLNLDKPQEDCNLSALNRYCSDPASIKNLSQLAKTSDGNFKLSVSHQTNSSLSNLKWIDGLNITIKPIHR